MKKIVLINFFFGKFPWYFSFFVKSCRTNSSIDFLIFTDNIIEDELPKNVQIINMTLTDFNKLSSEKLGFPINVVRPYKFCDFKPCFGLIFEDFIKSYDFWGISDIDLVFGRIKEFMTDDLLNNYDVISVRDDYPSGFFMLFKNTDKINNLFRKSKDYMTVLTSDNNFCFDECNYKYRFIEQGISIFDVDCEIESMHHLLMKEKEGNDIRVHFDFFVIEGTPGNLMWKNGILSYNNEYEILLYHFVSYKYNIFTKKKICHNIPDTFYIDKYNIRLKSYKGIFYYLINYIWPFTFNIFKNFEMKISKFLKIPFKKMQLGNYYLGETVWLITNNELGNNFIKTQYDITKPIYKMIFSRNTFFLKDYPYFFKAKNKKKKKFVRFDEVRDDGNTSIFDKQLRR